MRYLCARSWSCMDFSGSSPENLPLQETAMAMTLIYMPSPKTFNLKTRKFIRLPLASSLHDLQILQGQCLKSSQLTALQTQKLGLQSAPTLIFDFHPLPHSNLCSSLLLQISYLTFPNLSLPYRASNPKKLLPKNSHAGNQAPTTQQNVLKSPSK